MNFFLRFLLFFLLLTQICFAQWVQTNGPLGGEVMCITGIDTTLYAGTEIGVFRSTNWGSNWTPIGPDVFVTSLAVRSNDESGLYIFASIYNSGIWLTTNNGVSWDQVNFGLGNHSVNAIVINGTNLFAGTEDGVFLSPSNGDYWIPSSNGLTNKSVRSLAYIDNNLYAGTDSGLFVSINKGTSWSSTGLTNESINSVTSIGSNLFVGTDTSGVLLSTNNGTSWKIVSNLDMERNIRALVVIDTNLFAGTYQGIYRTPTKGDYWIPVNNGLINGDVESLFAMGTTLFAGTYSGVFRSTNNGANWNQLNVGLKNTVILGLAKSGERLYAAGRNGVYYSTDSGDSWTTLSTFWASSIAIDEQNLYCGHWGHLIYSENNGTSWEWIPLGGGRAFSFAFMDSYIFAGSEDRGVYRIIHNAPGWWTIFSNHQPDTLINCLAVIGTNLFAGTRNGIFFSTNYGENWIPLNNSLSSLEVSAFAVNGSNFFAGTRGSGVFLSTDVGNSWTEVNNGLTGLAKDVLSFAFSDDNIFVSTWRGGVYLSTNNGTSWTSVNTGAMDLDYGAISTVQSLAVIGSDLFAATRGAGVWRRPLTEMITEVEELTNGLPMEYSLVQNFPNPFNPYTNINYSIPKQSKVIIKIFDIIGNEIKTMVNEEKLPGYYQVNFEGAKFSSGVYFYQLKAGEFIQTKKMLLLK
jgi:photosystem II stability/assembly factor-like uncharacterized protein